MPNIDQHSLCLFSPAKINLFLHITAKRDDGYHDIQSVFRALDFGDQMRFTPSEQGTGALPIVLQGADQLCAFDNNLITKAARALLPYAKDPRPICITLDKRIPTGAGLGGGSSNCATTLIALNTLWQANLDTQALLSIGAKLGADVPFFIFSHAKRTDAEALGIGEVLSPCLLPARRYLLLMPEAHMATKVLFADDELERCTPIVTDIGGRTPDFDLQLRPPFFNCFEHIACRLSAPIRNALGYLHTLDTTAGARLTGTGSTVFLPIADDIDSATLAAWQANASCASVVAKSLFSAP